MKRSIPYLVEKDGAKGKLYYWQPSPLLRKAGWRKINYQKMIDTPEGPRILKKFSEIIAHVEARNELVRASQDGMAPAVGPKPVSLATWIVDFEADARFFKPLGEDSKRQYRSNFSLVRDWAGDRAPGAVSSEDVLNFYDALRDSRGLRTAGAVVSSIRRLYNWAETRGRSKNMPNPAAKLRIKRPPSRCIRWEDDEIAALIALIDRGASEDVNLNDAVLRAETPEPMIATAVAIGFYLGLRKADMIRHSPAQTKVLRGLRNGKPVERLGMVVTTRKTGERVAVPYHRELRRRLEAVTQGELVPYVTSATGRRFEGRWFSRRFELWRAALVAEGWDVGHKTFHDLRRSCVVKLAELGLTAMQIRSVTGHSLKTINEMIETYMVHSQVMSIEAIERWEAAG